MPTKVKGTTGVDKIEAGAVITNPSFSGNATVTGTLTVDSTASINGSNLPQQFGFRNLIINGDMKIAQRGTSSSGITLSSGTYYTVDRMGAWMTSAGTWTMSQDTDVPTGQGFAKSMKWSCTTANASLSAGSYLHLTHNIEAQNCQALKFGSSSAESFTLSFWVKSNKTGTYVVEFHHDDAGKTLSKTYTIDSANTWEKKTVTVAGNTANAIVSDNGMGLQIWHWLLAGTNFSSGTAHSTWTTRVTANDAAGITVNLADSTSNYINITGLQLEVGSGASDFEFLPYEVQLNRCQRYFEKYDSMFGMPMHCFNANTAYGNLSFKTVKRAAPTVSNGSPYTLYSGGSPKSISAISFGTAGNKLYSVNIGVTTSVTLTAANAGHFDIDAYLWIDSEL